MSRGQRISVFEFADHVRVALQLTYLIDTLEPRPTCTLYLRTDCREFMSPDTVTLGTVRYLNKYMMTLRFWIETAVLGRKVLVSTGPESASHFIQAAFARFLRVFRSRLSVFVIVRDLKPERGQFLLPDNLYSARSVLAVESDALRSACLAAGYSAKTYLYPTPITADLMPGPRPSLSKYKSDCVLSILLTGSLDSVRRDYNTLFEALAVLRRDGVKTRVIVGGHCLSDSAKDLLSKLARESNELVAAPLLSDAELDVLLLRADALVCLNRPQFYGGIKGSGAIGDAFFAGRKLLIHAELSTPHSEDGRFYTAFDSGESLAAHLSQVAIDRGRLRVPFAVLKEQTLRFAQELAQWLRL